MQIYDHNGDFDPDGAAAEVRGAGSITNVVARDAVLGTATAAALIDIAASLRVLADAEAYAMAGVIAGGQPAPTGDEVPDEPLDVTDLDAGHPVRLIVPGDPLDATEHRTGRLTGTGGVSEGIPWVGVVWDDTPDAGEVRIFAPHLEALAASATEAAVARTDTAPTRTLSDEEAAREALDDAELDGDFTSARTVREAADAVDALARQRKASKAAKLGKKGGK